MKSVELKKGYWMGPGGYYVYLLPRRVSEVEGLTGQCLIFHLA